MKLKIERISRKEITTQRGKSWKLSILSGGEWYSAWAGDWNQSWREGQTIDVEVQDKSGNNGVVYHNIMTPKPVGGGGGMTHDLDELKNMISQVMKELLEVKKLIVRDDPPVPSDESGEIPF